MKSVAVRSLVAAFLAIPITAAVHAADAPAKTNVILIMADDLNNDLGCYGHKLVKSPNIDRLAARGVRFDRAYCNYPVCNPSRASIMSGRRPDTTGVVDNVTPTRAVLGDAVFLPEHFRKNGYVAAKFGKIYHTGDEFEDERSWTSDLREDRRAKSAPADRIVKKDGSILIVRGDDEEFWDGYLANEAIRWLDANASSASPFFLAVGFRRPHTPYLATEKYRALYDAAKLNPLRGPEEHLAGVPKLALTYRLGQEAFPTDKAGEMMAAYYASLSYMDAQVGKLIDAIDRHKLWDNSVVVFVSDHGYHLGEHGGLWHKLTLFEESARVPLLVVPPGRNSATVSPRLVELVDLYPSLCELCGLEAPAGLEGDSFVPLLKDPTAPGKKAAHTVASRGERIAATRRLDPAVMGRSVRTERWRFTEWPDGTRELYDHDADPHEWKNLAADESHRKLIAELKALAEAAKLGN
ncbi:MAG: sulfatase [Planctomycetaceae bacterium]